ncbi:hypothetical protein FSP39_017436 [Pinctada imbricata]|uniref:G-protein coupled receptors family 1 profile domain-containing protein n=1 Tax=Pinctada imbricata TaxID=66713 RepID=A0AA89BTV4_PINIB|nr:hypothetical protein FSP39_017436 [Pinctada imbricata]
MQVLIGFSIVGIVISSFPIWTTEVVQIGNLSYCITKLSAVHVNAERILVYIDSFLTLLLPMILVLAIMCLTLKSANQALKRHRQRRQNNLATISENRRRRRSPQNQVAKLLTTVSLLFIILHLPSHVIRLKVMIQDKVLENYVSTDTDRTIQHVFSAMYYLNFDINWIVYLVSGAGFRRVFLRKICKYSSKDQPNDIDSPHLVDQLSEEIW